MCCAELSDADCHAPPPPLLLLVLVDILCVSEFSIFISCVIGSYMHNCPCMRHDYLGLVSLCISYSGLHFFISYSNSVSLHNCQIYHSTTTVKRISKNSYCYTECVIYENEPLQLAWMGNAEECPSVTQRPLGRDVTQRSPRRLRSLTEGSVASMQSVFWYLKMISFLKVYIIYRGCIWLWMYIFCYLSLSLFCFIVLSMHCIVIVKRSSP